MSTERIRGLGWCPQHSTIEALDELVHAMSSRTGAASPPLEP
jgi:hypothetical protein